MLEDFFTDSWVLARHRAGLFGAYVDEVAEAFRQEGYGRTSVRFKIAAVSRLGRWMLHRQLGARDVSEKLIAEFCPEQARRSLTRHGGMAALHALLASLRRAGVTPIPAQPAEGRLEQIQRDFATFLQQERALSQATLLNYCPVARMFISERLAGRSVDLSQLGVVDIHAFVSCHVHTYGRKRMQLMLTALRSFLRFLYLREQISVPLADHVPRVAGCQTSDPPKWIADDAIELTLARCRQRTSPSSRRDLAILMLLARLGLRVGEILSLELDDIRWETGDICVCGKGQQRKRLPLPGDVGQALAAYLKEARPSCSSRRVFLRTRAPYRALGNTTSLVAIVRRALARAGLAPPTTGTHLFRHSLATSMLQKGATLTEIGQILHHKSPNTTAIYAKVDIRGLRALAQPWPEADHEATVK